MENEWEGLGVEASVGTQSRERVFSAFVNGIQISRPSASQHIYV